MHVQVAKARKHHQEQQVLLSAQHSRRHALLATTGALGSPHKDRSQANDVVNARDQLPVGDANAAAKAWVNNSSVVRRAVAAGGHSDQF